VASLFPELPLPDSALGPSSGTSSGTAPLAEHLARLLERLQSRLGIEQIQRIEPVPDHRPERASQASAWTPPAARRVSPAPGSALPRPLWLLSDPLALTERKHRPYWNGPLALLAGPERIETGWWDDHLVERDYFIAQTEQAAWVWIFRTRPTQGDSGWFLQGVFG